MHFRFVVLLIVASFNTSAFSVIDSTSKDIEFQQHFIQVSEEYKKRYPGIFDRDFKSMEQDISNWKLINVPEEKLKKSEGIQRTLKSWEAILPKIIITDSLIDKKFPELDKKYSEVYPSIYKTEVKPLIFEIDYYKTLIRINARLKNAEEVIAKINLLDKSFAEFKNTDSFIEKNFPVLEANYKSGFPAIYKNSIYPLHASIMEYNNKSSIIEKKKAGQYILNQIQKFSEKFYEFKANDNNIAKNLLIVEKKYKHTYSDLYKLEVKPLNVEINVYKSLTIIAEKLEAGKELDAKIKYLDTKYPELVEQEKEIKARYQLFVKAYENNIENKALFKKGESLYNYYFELYKQTVYIKPKMENGDNILIALNKLITLASKNNTYLLEQLQHTRSQEDVKKVIGLKQF